MLERWRKQLFSEDGMKVANVLFILLYLIRNPPFTICAYTVWFVYLVYSVRHTKSKGMKVFYSVLNMLAMATILLNVYFTILQPGTMRKEIRELVKKTNAWKEYFVKTYKIYQVDSFIRDRFRGNPAGAVPDAKGLTDEQMLRIARELNNSETAFMFKTDFPGYNIEVRFFTPTTEAPICGHATIAAHYARAKERNMEGGTVVQEAKAGILPVEVVRTLSDYSITMIQGTPAVSTPSGDTVRERIADALGIAHEELCREYPVAVASAGYSRVVVPLYSNELLHGLRPDLQKLTKISKQIECNGYYVFILNPQNKILVHGRMSAPAIRTAEDSVTGNANGPLGAYLVHFNILQEENAPCFDFDVLQGEAIKRDGTMYIHVEKEHGAPKLVQITGNAVIASSAEITI